VSPVEQDFARRAGPLSRPGGDRPIFDAELRRKHVRRRVGAGGALVLLIAWLAGLASSGSPAKHATARQPATHVSAATAALQATAAEDQREENAVQQTLASLPYVTVAGAQHREVALTFDDGPGPFTPAVLGILERMHVPATFFVVGVSLRDFGTSLPRVLADGFVVGDHTQHHQPMALLSRKDQTAELQDQATAVRRLGAPMPQLFRPPYGSFNATTLDLAKRMKMLTVMWTIDTKDFQQPGVGAIVRSVLSGVKPGAIVLMHDAGGQRQQTIGALPVIINALRRRGYALVTVPRLLADNPPQAAGQIPITPGGG
jgi:peptidoglycan/xylan/chitin deacetylase (PgdA/CDA1 family)